MAASGTTFYGEYGTRAAEFIWRVSIETRTEVSDGHDGYIDQWTVVKSRLPASVEPLSGVDLERARQIDPRASHEVAFRWWSAYPAALVGGRARLIWHDGDIGDRVLEPVEPPRETQRRVRLAMICREAA